MLPLTTDLKSPWLTNSFYRSISSTSIDLPSFSILSTIFAPGRVPQQADGSSTPISSGVKTFRIWEASTKRLVFVLRISCLPPEGLTASASHCSVPVSVRLYLWERSLSHGDVQGLLQGWNNFAESRAVPGLFLWSFPYFPKYIVM